MARTFTDADFADTTPMQPAAQSAGRTFTDADFAEAKTLPSYANGLAPETAINQSPISLEDRARLSVGNEAGKMRFLKEKFGEVKKTKSGDLVVNNGGFWQRVDPSGLGDGDAWSMTKELLADVTDIAPTAVNIGAQIGAAAGLAAATGGASLLAQGGTSAAVGAALKAGETSLGRLVGTYEASDEEQLKDIGLEAILNMGGTMIAPAVKPTLTYIGNGLAKTGKLLGSAPTAVKEMVMEGWGNATGVGAKNIATLIDNPDAVSAAMKSVSALKDNAADTLIRQNVDDVAKIARASRAAASSMYDKLADDAISQVDDTFKADIGASVKNAFKALADMGAGAIDDTGKFSMYTKEQLANKLSQSGELSALLSDDKSLKLVTDMASELGQYSSAKEFTGKAGAAQLMKFRKILGDFTYRLKEEADEAFLAPAQNIISKVNEAVDNTVLGAFQLAKPVKSTVTGEMTDNLLAHTNQVYKNTLKELSPFLKAAGQATKQNSDAPFQTLYNQLNSMQGRNTVQKTAFDKAVDMVGTYGGNAGKAAKDMFNSIRVREAAAAFTPNFRRGLTAQGLLTGASIGAFVNPAAVATTAAIAGGSSPRLQKELITGGMKLKSFISGMTPAQRMQFINTPELFTSAINTVLQTPEIRNQATNQLMQQARQTITGGQ